ncbi:MAG: hypothetical protein R3B70_11005 [Polyangiaceae bacterium]
MRKRTTTTLFFGLMTAAAAFLTACDGGDSGTGGTGGAGPGGGGEGGAGGGAPGSPDGDPCATNDDCSGGFCLTQADFGFPNGYCTGACNSFVSCDEGSECIFFQNEPFCFKACGGMDGCGSGQQCLEIDEESGLSVCAPGCTMDEECAGYGVCDEDSGFCVIPEDCDAVGDEDGDGLADCEDPECATACQAQIDAACAAATSVDLAFGTPYDAAGDNSDGSALVAGICSGSGNKEDIYALHTPASADGVLVVSVQSATDLALYARSTCNAPSDLGCTDAYDGGTPEVLNLATSAGQTIYLYVDGSSFAGATGNEGAYTLSATLLALQPEVEPNNDDLTATEASTAALPAVLAGDLDQAADNDDWWLLDTSLLAGDKTITAETIGVAGASCAPTGDIDTYLEIVAGDGTVLDPANPDDPAENEDISGFSNWCSLAQIEAAPPGKYFLHVRTSALCIPDPGGPDCVFPYGIKVEVK